MGVERMSEKTIAEQNIDFCCDRLRLSNAEKMRLVEAVKFSGIGIQEAIQALANAFAQIDVKELEAAFKGFKSQSLAKPNKPGIYRNQQAAHWANQHNHKRK